MGNRVMFTHKVTWIDYFRDRNGDWDSEVMEMKCSSKEHAERYAEQIKENRHYGHIEIIEFVTPIMSKPDDEE
jgi:hypothetical protein